MSSYLQNAYICVFCITQRAHNPLWTCINIPLKHPSSSPPVWPPKWHLCHYGNINYLQEPWDSSWPCTHNKTLPPTLNAADQTTPIKQNNKSSLILTHCRLLTNTVFVCHKLLHKSRFKCLAMLTKLFGLYLKICLFIFYVTFIVTNVTNIH